MSSPRDIDIDDTTQAGPAAIRGGLLRTLGYVGGILATLVSAPLLVRHLGDADFGRYSAVLAVIAIVAGLTEGGVNTVALRELSATADPRRRDQLMRELLGLRLALGVASVVLAIAFSALAGYGETLVVGTLIAAFGQLLAMTQTLLATVLQSRLRFGWVALTEFLRQAVTAVLVVALVVLDGGVVAFLCTGVGAGLVVLILTVLQVRGTISLRPAFHPRHWWPLMRDTAVFAVAIAVNTLYFRIVLVIMSVVATAAETGYFAISFRIIEVLIGVPGLLIGAAFPIVARAARSDRARYDAASGRLFELAFLFGVLCTLGLLLSAPFAIEILTGDRHHPSVGVLEIQSAAMIASFVAAATGYALLGIGRYAGTLIANVASLVVAVGLALVLAPRHGAVGAAIAAVVADFTLAAVNAVMLVRRGGPPLPLGIVPVALAAGACGWAAGSAVGVHPLLEAAVGAAVFLGVLALLRRFPPEVAELLSRSRARGATR
jgi:O-antigen/teichoic acid export membrane protein